jgi:hypothetical protein
MLAVHQIPSKTSKGASIHIVVAKPAKLALLQKGTKITSTWTAGRDAVDYDFRLLANSALIENPQTWLTGMSWEVELPTGTTAEQIRGEARSIAPGQMENGVIR